MNLITLRLKAFFFEGQARNIRIKKNILGLAFLKGLSILIGVLLVPLTLGYLDPTKYGIWLTLSSVIAWAGFFDFGLSNGLRNQLGEALVKEDLRLARTLVSTTLTMLMAIMAFVYLLFWLVNPFLDWHVILNAPKSMNSEIDTLVVVVFSFFALRFVSGLIFTLLATYQRPALAELFNVIASLLSLSIIYILSLITDNSLLYLGASLSGITALVPLVISIWFFRKSFRNISPSIRYVDLQKIKGLAGQGSQFFVLQITSLILSMTDLIIIARLFGPMEVVPYKIAYMLFSNVIAVFGIIANPFWAAYNEAYHKQDFEWIKQATKKLLYIWAALAFSTIGLVILSDFIYILWVGKKINVSTSLSLAMGVYAILQTLNSIFAIFVFSTGKLRLLTYMAIFVGLTNIPLCIFLGKTMGLGSTGVILATIVGTFLNLSLGVIQYYKLSSGKGSGIWVR